MLSIAALSITARAEPACGESGAPVVVVAFSGEPWEAALEAGVLVHLRAGLEPAGFQVCSAAGGAGRASRVPVATVELRRNAGERVAATIEVRDGITAKRVARDIDLSALPEDGRALGVGVAADELLRASWVELSLADAPPPARVPPPAVERSVQASLRSPSRRTAALVRASGEGSAGGLVLLGGNLALRHWMTPKLGFEIGVALAKARSVSSAHGETTGSAIGVEASVLLELVRVGGLALHVEAGLSAAEVRLRGEPRAGSLGEAGAEVALVPRAGVGITVARGAFAVSAQGGPSFAARRVSARDDGHDVTGVSGLGWYASVGPGVVF